MVETIIFVEQEVLPKDMANSEGSVTFQSIMLNSEESENSGSLNLGPSISKGKQHPEEVGLFGDFLMLYSFQLLHIIVYSSSR